MEERVTGAAGGEAAERGRRRRRAMQTGYRIAVLLTAAALWLLTGEAALAESAGGSRYDAPLWTWLTAIGVSLALSLIGLLIGRWFKQKRARLERSD